MFASATRMDGTAATALLLLGVATVASWLGRRRPKADFFEDALAWKAYVVGRIYPVSAALFLLLLVASLLRR